MAPNRLLPLRVRGTVAVPGVNERGRRTHAHGDSLMARIASVCGSEDMVTDNDGVDKKGNAIGNLLDLDAIFWLTSSVNRPSRIGG